MIRSCALSLTAAVVLCWFPGTVDSVAASTGHLQEREWPTEGEDAIDQMLGYAQMYNMRRMQVPPDQRITDFRSLILLADDLMAAPGTASNPEIDHKAIAFQIKAQSLVGLTANGDPAARTQLIEFAEANYEHENADFRKSARFLRMTLALSDYARDGGDTSDITNQADQILTAFPAELPVARRLLAVAEQLSQTGNKEVALEVLRKVEADLANVEEPELKRFLLVVRDSIHLTEIGFVQMITMIQQEPDDDHSAFVQVVKNLTTRNDMGRKIYTEIINATRWMETRQRYDDVREIYAALGETLAGNSDTELLEMAARDREMAEKRINSVGTKIEITGQNGAGEAFDASMVEGKKVVALYFWSTEVPQSVQALQAMIQIRARFEANGYELVAICIDEDVGRARGMFGGRMPPFVALFQTDETSRQLQENLGVQNVPFLLLLDEQQNVISPRLSLQTLTDKLNELLGPPANRGG